MKRIILVRHAKSSWDNVNLSDFERPLSSRWIKEIKFVSKILKKLDLKTDLILCSSSVRTRETLEWLWEELDASNEKIVYDKWIYDYHMSEGLDYYFDLISNIEKNKNNIILVWHNPFISSLTWFLTWNDNLWMWTLWIAIIDFDIEKWEEIKKIKWRLEIFINTGYILKIES